MESNIRLLQKRQTISRCEAFSDYLELQLKVGGGPHHMALVDNPTDEAALTIIWLPLAFDPERHADLSACKREYILSAECVERCVDFYGHPKRLYAQFGVTDGSVEDGAVDLYNANRHLVEGAPLVGELVADEIPAMKKLAAGRPAKTIWTELVASARDESVAERDANDPFLSHPYAKTDDNGNSWIRACTDADGRRLSDDWQSAFNRMLRDVSPDRSLSTYNRLNLVPSGMFEFIQPILDVMLRRSADVFPSIPVTTGKGNEFGDDREDREKDWPWGPSYSFAAGFGTEGFKYIAAVMARRDNGLRWYNYSTLDTKNFYQRQEYLDLIKDAMEKHGMPVGMTRLDAVEVGRLIDADDTVTKPLQWFVRLAALQILKYCRLDDSDVDNPLVTAMYRGHRSVVHFPPTGLQVPLTSSFNQQAATAVAKTLQMNWGTKDDRTAAQAAYYAAFSMLNVSDLPRQLELPVELQTPGRVEFVQSQRTHTPFFNTGIHVSGFAEIRPDGTIDKNASTDDNGESAIAFKWPDDRVDAGAIANWRLALPDYAPTELPANFFMDQFPNLMPLGCREGLADAINTVEVVELLRGNISGSEIGRMLTKEFFQLACLPHSAAETEVFKCGKTRASEMLMGAYCPGLTEIVPNRMESAPAQRACASTIQKHGTYLFGEFKLSSRPDNHFLSVDTMSGLLTGGRAAGPGEVMSNDSSLFLKHSPGYTALTGITNEMLLSRTMPFFFAPLSEAQRCDKKRAKFLIDSGAMRIRLSTLRYISENDLVRKVMAAELDPGQHRFIAMVTISKLLNPGSQIEEYLDLAVEYLRQQNKTFKLNGGETGDNPIFNPREIFERCSLTIFGGMSADKLTLDEFLESIVKRDDERRSYDMILRDAGITRLRARKLLKSQLTDPTEKPFIRQASKSSEMFEVIYVPQDKSPLTVNKHRVECVKWVSIGTPVSAETGHIEMVVDEAKRAEAHNLDLPELDPTEKVKRMLKNGTM